MQASPPRNRRKAIIFTVLLHVFLGLAVFVGLEFSDYRPLSGPPVDIIQAEVLTETPSKKLPVVEPKPLPLPPQPEPEPEPKPEPKPKPIPPPPEPEKLKEDEQKKLIEKQQAEAKRQEEIAVQEKAKAKKKAEEVAKKKEEQQKAEAEAKQKAADAAKKQKEEAEAKRKLAAEEEAKRKAAAEQAIREKALQDAMAQEEREQELIPLKAAYSAAISQQITRNWLRPPEISNELKCEVRVTQLPDGSVSGARITKSSGNVTFDESVIKAIYKASPLPQPSTPEIFDKDLDIAFCSTGNVC